MLVASAEGEEAVSGSSAAAAASVEQPIAVWAPSQVPEGSAHVYACV